MLKTISDLFVSLGVHPIVGGFLLGVLACILLSLFKRALRTAGRDSMNDSLTRFRDPSAVSEKPAPVAKLTYTFDNATKALPDPIAAQVLQSLREGSKIEAIKIFKDATGLGLKESKDIVEAMQSKLGL